MHKLLQYGSIASVTKFWSTPLPKIHSIFAHFSDVSAAICLYLFLSISICCCPLKYVCILYKNRSVWLWNIIQLCLFHPQCALILACFALTLLPCARFGQRNGLICQPTRHRHSSFTPGYGPCSCSLRYSWRTLSTYLSSFRNLLLNLCHHERLPPHSHYQASHWWIQLGHVPGLNDLGV